MADEEAMLATPTVSNLGNIISGVATNVPPPGAPILTATNQSFRNSRPNELPIPDLAIPGVPHVAPVSSGGAPAPAATTPASTSVTRRPSNEPVPVIGPSQLSPPVTTPAAAGASTATAHPPISAPQVAAVAAPTPTTNVAPPLSVSVPVPSSVSSTSPATGSSERLAPPPATSGVATPSSSATSTSSLSAASPSSGAAATSGPGPTPTNANASFRGLNKQILHNLAAAANSPNAPVPAVGVQLGSQSAQRETSPKSKKDKHSLNDSMSSHRGAMTSPSPTAISDNNTSILSGVLMKLHEGKWTGRRWQRRYFVLDKTLGVLRMFGSEKEALNVKKFNACRDVFDLNCADAVLMYEKQFAERAATNWYFQISMQGLPGADVQVKRGNPGILKLYAEFEIDYSIWTYAVANCINRKYQEDGYMDQNLIAAAAASAATDPASISSDEDEGDDEEEEEEEDPSVEPSRDPSTVLQQEPSSILASLPSPVTPLDPGTVVAQPNPTINVMEGSPPKLSAGGAPPVSAATTQGSPTQQPPPALPKLSTAVPAATTVANEPTSGTGTGSGRTPGGTVSFHAQTGLRHRGGGSHGAHPSEASSTTHGTTPLNTVSPRFSTVYSRTSPRSPMIWNDPNRSPWNLELHFSLSGLPSCIAGCLGFSTLVLLTRFIPFWWLSIGLAIGSALTVANCYTSEIRQPAGGGFRSRSSMAAIQSSSSFGSKIPSSGGSFHSPIAVSATTNFPAGAVSPPLLSPPAAPAPSSPFSAVAAIIPTIAEAVVEATAPSSSIPAGVPDQPIHPAGASMLKQQDGESLPHRWNHCDATTFQVRVGPDYRRNKLKAPSGPAIGKVFAVDLFRTPHKITNVRPQLQIPSGIVPEGGHLFIINVMLPNYPPSMWQKVWDGPGYSMILCITLDAETMIKTKEATNGHLGLLRRFLNAQLEPNPTDIYDRMKMIGRFINPEEADLYAAERSLVSKYNGKPVLTRPQHKIIHGDDYTEVDVDVHTFGLLGRKGVNGFLPRICKMVLDVGFVLEAHTDDELPEVLLACVETHKFQLEDAKSWY